jgi:hypothetical protein
MRKYSLEIVRYKSETAKETFNLTIGITSFLCKFLDFKRRVIDVSLVCRCDTDIRAQHLVSEAFPPFDLQDEQ